MGGVGTFDDFFVAVVLSPLLAASSFALIMVWMFGVLKGKAVGRHNNNNIIIESKKMRPKNMAVRLCFSRFSRGRH